MKKFYYFLLSFNFLFLLILFFLYFLAYCYGYKKGYKEAKREIIIKTDTLKVYVRDTIFTIKEIQIKYTKRDTDTVFLERKIFLPHQIPFYLLKREPFLLQFKQEKEKFSLNAYFVYNQKTLIPFINIRFNKYNLLGGYDIISKRYFIGLGLTLFSF